MTKLNKTDKKTIFELGRQSVLNRELSIEERIAIVNDNYIQAPNDCNQVYQTINGSECMYKHGCSWKLYYGSGLEPNINAYCCKDWSEKK